MLITAYESAISQQSAERAKIIANETNKKPKMSENSKTGSSNNEENETNIGEYKIGDSVRATYEVDGVDYEAEIIAIDVKNESCLVRFVGYENEQCVKMADLVDSWGTDEQEKQRIEAADNEEDIEGTDDDPESNILFQRQNISTGSANLPIPPMPPIPPMLADSLQQESEEFSAMLMAWYMSGYYTGFYQGRRFARQVQQKVAGKQNKTKNVKFNSK